MIKISELIIQIYDVVCTYAITGICLQKLFDIIKRKTPLNRQVFQHAIRILTIRSKCILFMLNSDTSVNLISINDFEIVFIKPTRILIYKFYDIQNYENALSLNSIPGRILEALASTAKVGSTVAEICGSIGFTSSNIYEIVDKLTLLGLISKFAILGKTKSDLKNVGRVKNSSRTIIYFLNKFHNPYINVNESYRIETNDTTILQVTDWISNILAKNNIFCTSLSELCKLSGLSRGNIDFIKSRIICFEELGILLNLQVFNKGSNNFVRLKEQRYIKQELKSDVKFGIGCVNQSSTFDLIDQYLHFISDGLNLNSTRLLLGIHNKRIFRVFQDIRSHIDCQLTQELDRKSLVQTLRPQSMFQNILSFSEIEYYLLDQNTSDIIKNFNSTVISLEEDFLLLFQRILHLLVHHNDMMEEQELTNKILKSDKVVKQYELACCIKLLETLDEIRIFSINFNEFSDGDNSIRILFLPSIQIFDKKIENFIESTSFNHSLSTTYVQDTTVELDEVDKYISQQVRNVSAIHALMQLPELSERDILKSIHLELFKRSRFDLSNNCLMNLNLCTVLGGLKYRNLFKYFNFPDNYKEIVNARSFTSITILDALILQAIFLNLSFYDYLQLLRNSNLQNTWMTMKSYYNRKLLECIVYLQSFNLISMPIASELIPVTGNLNFHAVSKYVNSLDLTVIDNFFHSECLVNVKPSNDKCDILRDEDINNYWGQYTNEMTTSLHISSRADPVSENPNNPLINHEFQVDLTVTILPNYSISKVDSMNGIRPFKVKPLKIMQFDSEGEDCWTQSQDARLLELFLKYVYNSIYNCKLPSPVKCWNLLLRNANEKEAATKSILYNINNINLKNYAAKAVNVISASNALEVCHSQKFSRRRLLSLLDKYKTLIDIVCFILMTKELRLLDEFVLDICQIIPDYVLSKSDNLSEESPTLHVIHKLLQFNFDDVTMKNQHLTELEQVPTNIFNEVLSSLWYRKLVNSQLVVNKVTKEQIVSLNNNFFSLAEEIENEIYGVFYDWMKSIHKLKASRKFQPRSNTLNLVTYAGLISQEDSDIWINVKTKIITHNLTQSPLNWMSPEVKPKDKLIFQINKHFGAQDCLKVSSLNRIVGEVQYTGYASIRSRFNTDCVKYTFKSIASFYHESVNSIVTELLGSAGNRGLKKSFIIECVTKRLNHCSKCKKCVKAINTCLSKMKCCSSNRVSLCDRTYVLPVFASNYYEGDDSKYCPWNGSSGYVNYDVLHHFMAQASSILTFKPFSTLSQITESLWMLEPYQVASLLSIMSSKGLIQKSFSRLNVSRVLSSPFAEDGNKTTDCEEIYCLAFFE